jgi:long-chain acyl-CoA synthetase
MSGYWRRPEDTEEALSDGWLRTGDIVTMDESGFLFIVDRIKDLIITGGENVYPREIEEVLFEHPKIKEAVVVGVPHPFGGEVAKAFVVPKPGEELSKPEVITFARERLAKHKVPRAVEFRTDLPKSSAGKVLRRVLAEEEKERAEKRPRRTRS